MSSRMDRFLLLSGAIASAIFIVFPVLGIGFFFPGYSHVLDSISRQGAPDSPVSLATNLSFFLVGAFVILFGLGLYRVFGKGRFGRIGTAIVLIAGISGILVGAFPTDPPGAVHSAGYAWHVFSATLAGVLGFVAVSMFWVREYRRGANRAWIVAVPLLLAPSALFGLLFITGNPWVLPIYGLSERISLGLLMALVFSVSLSLYRTLPVNGS